MKFTKIRNDSHEMDHSTGKKQKALFLLYLEAVFCVSLRH